MYTNAVVCLPINHVAFVKTASDFSSCNAFNFLPQVKKQKGGGCRFSFESNIINSIPFMGNVL
jgi:hypothetical protein